MKYKHSIYKDIVIFHDPEIAQYTAEYKKRLFVADSIAVIKRCIDTALSYEKAVLLRSLGKHQFK